MDNLPAPLIPKFAELGMGGNGEYDRVALVTDVRGGTNFDGLFQALDGLKAMKCGYRIVFMEASDPVIIRRYKETRRNHPLAEECGSLEEAIALERNMLAPLKERADWVIDTSNLSTRALRGELLRMFSKNAAERSMEVRVMSFGFKHGIPAEADLVFDVRFLPNPYYVADQSQEFLKKLTDFVTYLLPRYLEEGKAALVIAVGCTGGHHRSVAVAHALAETIRGLNYPVTESHRDMGRT